MIRKSSKINDSKRKKNEIPSNNMEAITQILQQSMGHVSLNIESEKIRSSFAPSQDAFGEIEFTGLNQTAKFVRLLTSTTESSIQGILRTKWELSPPTLIISVFGREFEKKRKLKMIFKKGLWKAAENAGCWVITEGFNMGITKLAGDAVRDYTDAYGGNKMLAIGVTPWNCVAKNDILENAIKQGNNPAIYQSEEEAGESDSEDVQVVNREKSLDTNHSFFILNESSHGDKSIFQDLEFRTKFERSVSSWKSFTSVEEQKSESHIPICGLVVGGDIYTLRQVCNSIMVNKCPIVACQGTTGSADVFSIGLTTSQKFILEESPDDPDVVPLETRLELILKECLHKMNPEISDYTEDAKVLKLIFTDLSFLISVFDMEENWDLDGYIISSLLSSAGTDTGGNQLNLEQLKITLTLNRSDIAKDKIFLEDKKWKKGDLNEYMFNALMSDRHDFVKLFLEQGFSLEDFLTIYTLERLYTEQLKTIDSRVSIFKQLWDHYKTHKKTLRGDKQLNSKFVTNVKLKEVGKIIKVLVGDFYHPVYLSKEFQNICMKSLMTNINIKATNPKKMSISNKLELSRKTNEFENSATNTTSEKEEKKPNGILRRSSSLEMANIMVTLNKRKMKSNGSTEIEFISNKSSSKTEIYSNIKNQKNHNEKHAIIRRSSSLDMIYLIMNSKKSESSIGESNMIESDKKPLHQQSNGSNKNKKLIRRNSSLDFVKVDNAFFANYRTKSSTKAQKSKIFKVKSTSKKLNSQDNIDDLDDNQLNEINLERPARELMIWSLLMGKLQMTKLFWTIEKEPIAGALLCSIMVTSLASKTDDFTDKEDYEQLADHFEEQAEGVLNQCYMEDEGRAQMLINKDLQYYGHSSVVLLAAEGESIKFMAHPCCQDFLTTTWYGELSSKNSVLRLLCGVFFGVTLPLFIPNIIIYKSTEELDLEPQQTDNIENAYFAKDNDNFSEKSYSTSSFNKFILQIYGFYFAPITRFAYSALSYATFLLLFTIFVMYRFTVNFTYEEMIITFWVGTLLIEEIKQISSKSLSGISFSTYFADGWNKMDSSAIVLYVIGFVFRLITYINRNSELVNLQTEFTIILTDSNFIAAQVLICFSLFIFYIRAIYFFSIHIALGPKLIMIRKMMTNDLVPFMIILSVFTIGYGVVSVTLGNPIALQFTGNWFENNSIPLTQLDVGSTILELTLRSYFAMFGDFNLDNMRDLTPSCVPNQPNNVPTLVSRIIRPIFLGFYVLLTNILLFNLLIAMFTTTYEEIDDSSVYYWNFQRYQMLSEFNYRSPIAAPLIIFWHFYELYYFLKRIFGNDDQLQLYDNPFCIDLLDLKKKRELMKWEHMKAMDYLRNPNEQGHSSKKGLDGRSLVFRGQGSNQPAPTPLALQTTESKVDLSGITEELNHELDRRFKDIDNKLMKFNDIEVQITGVLDAVKNLKNNIEILTNSQNELITKVEIIPQCNCQEIAQKTKENYDEGNRKIEMTVSNAVMALKEELQPILIELINNCMKDINLTKPEETESELTFTIIDDIGDVNKDPFYVPDVEDPTTGRIIERIVNNHRMWRYLPFNFESYPGMRMKVPNNIISWQMPYSEYSAYDASDDELFYPNEYCHDIDNPMKYKDSFNRYDQNNKIKRESMLGQYTVDSESSAPLNPTGRTGLKGKGLLPHWGPNHSITILFTRWSKNENGSLLEKNNKPVLQYIALERNKRFGIPWFLVDHMPTCDLNECSIKTTLSYLEQRLRSLFSTRKSDFLQKRIMAADCSQTYKGFLDDHLNADNAWVETVVINFHESQTFPFTDDLLKIFMEKNSPETIKWLDLTHSLNLRASHAIILKILAQKTNSYF